MEKNVLKTNKLYFQVLRRDIPAPTESERVKIYFDAFDRLNSRIRSVIAGIIPHGFEGEFTADKFQLWKDACKYRNLDCGVAWGIGGTDNSKRKGEYYGTLATAENPVVTLIDVEVNSWEGSSALQAAHDLCQGFRSKSARGNLICQTWMVPTVHMGVPYSTFETYCNAFASMDYYNDFSGSNRYWVNVGWRNQSWGQLQREVLAPQRGRRAVLPRLSTIQAYGWSDILTSLVTALCSDSSGGMILWEQSTSGVTPDWWLQSATQIGIERFAALVERGFSGPSAVWDFQASTPDLVIDGLCGSATANALGVP